MKKERLELKHLAPYLPYELESVVDYDPKNSKEEMCIAGVFSGDLYEVIDNEKVFVILKPLSDLDDLIYDEFIKLENSKNKDYENEIINLFCFENTKETSDISCADINKLPYECVEYMFKNHYDVFGLIDKGLAISIHDVK